MSRARYYMVCDIMPGVLPKENRALKEDFLPKKLPVTQKSLQNDFFTLRFGRVEFKRVQRRPTYPTIAGKQRNGEVEKPSKIGFIVPASVSKKSTGRNLLKRRARAIVKKIIPQIKKGFFISFFFKKGVSGLNFCDLEKIIIEALKKANLLS